MGIKVEELKGVNTSISVKKYFLRSIQHNDWAVYTVILNKERVKTELRSKVGKKKLYNYLSRVLIEKINFSKDLPALTLVVDKMKNKREIKDFNQYLENQLSAYLPLNCMFYVYHKDSKEHAGLQAVDLFCWGIYRKYTMNDTIWYRSFSHKIKHEMVYLR